MTKLFLKFNEQLDDVELKLTGGGTVIIEAIKHQKPDVLVYELVNYIKYEHPSTLEFPNYRNEKLIEELNKIGIIYDENCKKLVYND